MYLDFQKEFAYIAIPKTGTYSIHEFFGYSHNHPEPDVHHVTAEYLVDVMPEIKDFFKFAFVRNPWDKLLSVYNDFTKRRVYQYSGLIRMDKPLLHEFKNFEDFCLRLHTSEWLQNVFFRPQVDFVFIDGQMIDFVGRFENIQQDFKIICSFIDVPYNILNYKNVGNYQHGYRDHYSPQMIEAVANLYSQDIKAFGYEF